MDLAITFAALSIIPENHGKNLILDYLTIDALKSYDGKRDKPIIDDIGLNHYISQNLYDLQFQNATTLFTQNIMNEVGNNTVFPGLYENGVEVLQTQINIINKLRNSLPEKFKIDVIPAINLMLFLSNTISKINEYQRNIDISTDEKVEIYIPTSKDLNKIKSSLVFPTEFVENICKVTKANISVLDSFLLNFYDIDNYKNELGNSNNPINLKPLIKVEAAYLLVSPTNIVSSLVHFIWKKCIEFDCIDLIIKGFHSEIDQTIFYRIRNFGLKAESIVQKDLMQVNEFNSCSFIIDADKLVSIVFIHDLGVGYNSESLFDDNFYTTTGKEEDYIIEINGKLKAEHPDYKILSIALFSSIGRDFYTMYSDLRSEYFIQIPSFDFLHLSKCEEIDWVDIWYFIIALQDFKVSSGFGVQLDFIDLYHLYINRKHSFYLDDRIPKDSIISIDIEGNGKSNYSKDATLKADRHIVPYINDDGKYVGKIVVERFPGSEKYIERYYVKKNYQDIEYYISGMAFGLWIKADPEDSENEFETHYFIIDAICYWINELKPFINSMINGEFKPLKIKIKISDFSKFDEYARKVGNEYEQEELFKELSKGQLLEVEISSKIASQIFRSDNLAEICIMKFLISKIFSSLNYDEIDYLKVEKMISKVMPLGDKKMLLFNSNNSDISLYKFSNEKFRFLKESRIQHYMDKLPSIIGSNYPEEGEIFDKEVKTKFLNKVIDSLLNQLRKLVADLDHFEFIKFVMLNCDAGWYVRTENQMRLHTRKLCFSVTENILVEEKEFHENLDRSMINNRVLIEHLCCEFKTGAKKFSIQDFDDCIALMQLIILYGNHREALESEIFNVRISVLPSGRIGSNYHEFVNVFFENYRTERQKQNIYNSEDAFQNYYQENTDDVNKKTPQIIDDAFKSEFGISVSDLLLVIIILEEYALKNKLSIVEISKTEILRILLIDSGLTLGTVESALNLLCLTDQNGVDYITNAPWKYNRRLSYLQKPLILLNRKKEPDLVILFTPRHLTMSQRQLKHLMVSNRYKVNQASKVKTALSIFKVERSEIIIKEVKDWLAYNDINNFHTDVWIGPKMKLKYSRPIGDIDILIIDNHHKVILSIECKRTEEANNISQLIQQKEDYLDKDKSYLKKHFIRHKFLIEDQTEVSKVFKIKKDQYEVHSCLISYEILGIKFLPNIELPMQIFSLFEIKQMSYNEFVKQLKLFK
jgi:hypothetical protein